MNPIDAIDRAIELLNEIPVKGWESINAMLAVNVCLEKAKKSVRVMVQDAVAAKETPVEVNQNGI